LKENLAKAARGEEATIDTQLRSYSYEEILDITFKLLVNTDVFAKENNQWVDKSADGAYMMSVLTGSEDIRVVGILRPAEDATAGAVSGMIGYTEELMSHLIQKVRDSSIVREQMASPDVDVFTGLPFVTSDQEKVYTMEELQAYCATLPEAQQQEIAGYVQQMMASGLDETAAATRIMHSIVSGAEGASYEGNLQKLGVSDPDEPSAISLYPIDFEAKDEISDLITEYNRLQSEEKQLTYTDYIGLMISSITTIINAVSYILIAFVSVSLVVSSIMIGIITYISVLERIREIGILRAIGASKRDISRVFNAEILSIGFASGVLGIGTTLLLLIPINKIIEALTELSGVAVLPPQGGIILVIISMFMTFLAGLIPARIAANKDPVIALRTE
jgi:putative ABC transport system permease protein